MTVQASQHKTNLKCLASTAVENYTHSSSRYYSVRAGCIIVPIDSLWELPQIDSGSLRERGEVHTVAIQKTGEDEAQPLQPMLYPALYEIRTVVLPIKDEGLVASLFTICGVPFIRAADSGAHDLRDDLCVAWGYSSDRPSVIDSGMKVPLQIENRKISLTLTGLNSSVVNFFAEILKSSFPNLMIEVKSSAKLPAIP